MTLLAAVKASTERAVRNMCDITSSNLKFICIMQNIIVMCFHNRINEIIIIELRFTLGYTYYSDVFDIVKKLLSKFQFI